MSARLLLGDEYICCVCNVSNEKGDEVVFALFILSPLSCLYVSVVTSSVCLQFGVATSMQGRGSAPLAPVAFTLMLTRFVCAVWWGS